ncbi:MAG: hypothetical protein BA864_07625 [Desulfuromonadales bacterium C00003093]|nr:MAG: hypothetical protein BA864_07625 [Desulfuromonadales bacterium C00003093]
MRFAVDQPVNFPSTKFVYLKIFLPGNELFKSRGEIRWTRKIEGDIREQVGVQFAMATDFHSRLKEKFNQIYSQFKMVTPKFLSVAFCIQMKRKELYHTVWEGRNQKWYAQQI